MTKVTRQYTRVVFKTQAAVQSDSASLEGQVDNLCLNGMFLTAPDAGKVKDGEQVAVSIMIEGQASLMTIRMNGKVLRHQAQGLAIQFNPRAAKLDSILLLKTVIVSNGGDREKLEAEFGEIIRAAQQQIKDIKPHPISSK